MGYTPTVRELSYFPFLKKSQDFTRTKYSSLDALLAGDHGDHLIRSAIERIRDALSQKRTFGEGTTDSPEEMMASYALARVIVSCIKDRQMIDRLTRYEAERAYYYLRNEGTDENSWNLNFNRTESGFSRLFLYIAEELGISIRCGWLSLVDYVELVSPIREDRFRLVNRIIDKGKVQVHDDEMYELVRERLRVILRRDLPHHVPQPFCERLAPRLAEIQKAYQEHMLQNFGAIEESAFPPCIQSLIQAITSGANLTHPGRFSLTSFLHNIGMEKSQIAQLFSRAPDFDADKTMYQVGHITGGGGTEYTAPSCAAMRTTGLCVRPDTLCEKINHPLSYYISRKKRSKPALKEKLEEKNNQMKKN
ncbi:MAG: DNA primase regulatory subunit PriL [Methanoregula sp.]|nr:MAG: DNA primase regulatory subunit PriL [Methanoregula sp.]